MARMFLVTIILIIVVVYFKYKKYKYKKLNNSPVNLVMERKYKKWYSVNGKVVNRDYMAIFEIDRVIFELKEAFEVSGITPKELKDYIDFLDGEDSQSKYGLKDILLTILGFFGTNSIISQLFPNFSISIVYEFVTKQYGTYQKILEAVFILVLYIFIYILLFWVMYQFMNMDTLYKNKQRLFFLKRLNDIWNFEKNEELTEHEDILKHFKEHPKTIYANISFSEHWLSKLLDKSTGKNFMIYSKYFSSKLSLVEKRWGAVRPFALSYLYPSLSGFALLMMCFIEPSGFFENAVIVFPYTLFLLIFFFCYCSQLDFYSEELEKIEINPQKRYRYGFRKFNRGWKALLVTFSYLIALIINWFFGNISYIKIIPIIAALLYGYFRTIDAKEIE